MFQVVLKLAKRQSLLEIDVPVARAHVVHDGDLRWNLTLRRPSLCEESTDVWRIDVCVVVSLPLDTVNIVDRWLMEVVREGEDSFLQRCHATRLV